MTRVEGPRPLPPGSQGPEDDFKTSINDTLSKIGNALRKIPEFFKGIGSKIQGMVSKSDFPKLNESSNNKFVLTIKSMFANFVSVHKGGEFAKTELSTQYQHG